MPKKFYAVKTGINPGIYHDWDECKKQVIGFKNASYKGFDSLEEAENFLNGKNCSADIKKSGFEEDNIEKIIFDSKKNTDTAFAYVDGSYDVKSKDFSCGIVFIHNGTQKNFAKKFGFCDTSSMRNVAGEIEGALAAMRFCIDLKISTLNLYYDYDGIAKWCLNEWKTNKQSTREYKKFYDSIKNDLRVNFIKVKGHSGNKLNDLADTLAKSALGMMDENFINF